MVTLLIQRDRTEPASFEFRTAGGTAQAGGDFITATGTLTFGAGEMTKAFAVQLRDDDGGEGVETFSFELLNPSTGSVLGAPATAFVVLLVRRFIAAFGRRRSRAVVPGHALRAPTQSGDKSPHQSAAREITRSESSRCGRARRGPRSRRILRSPARTFSAPSRPASPCSCGAGTYRQ